MNHTMGRLSLVLRTPFGLPAIGLLLAGAGAVSGIVAIVHRQPPRQP
jgi:hypothetical protein